MNKTELIQSVTDTMPEKLFTTPITNRIAATLSAEVKSFGSKLDYLNKIDSNELNSEALDLLSWNYLITSTNTKETWAKLFCEGLPNYANREQFTSKDVDDATEYSNRLQVIIDNAFRCDIEPIINFDGYANELAALQDARRKILKNKRKVAAEDRADHPQELNHEELIAAVQDAMPSQVIRQTMLKHITDSRQAEISKLENDYLTKLGLTFDPNKIEWTFSADTSDSNAVWAKRFCETLPDFKTRDTFTVKDVSAAHTYDHRLAVILAHPEAVNLIVAPDTSIIAGGEVQRLAIEAKFSERASESLNPLAIGATLQEDGIDFTSDQLAYLHEHQYPSDTKPADLKWKVIVKADKVPIHFLGRYFYEHYIGNNKSGNVVAQYMIDGILKKINSTTVADILSKLYQQKPDYFSVNLTPNATPTEVAAEQ